MGLSKVFFGFGTNELEDGDADLDRRRRGEGDLRRSGDRLLRSRERDLDLVRLLRSRSLSRSLLSL